MWHICTIIFAKKNEKWAPIVLLGYVFSIKHNIKFNETVEWQLSWYMRTDEQEYIMNLIDTFPLHEHTKKL